MLKSILKKSLIPVSFAVIFFGTSVLGLADAAQVKNQINTWGRTVLDIAKTLIKWGGIFAILGLAFALYFTQDEGAGKKLKLSLAIIFIATLLAWMADAIIGSFITG